MRRVISIYVWLALGAGLLTLAAPVSRLLPRWVAPPLVALVAGVVVRAIGGSPEAFGITDVPEVCEHASRLALAAGLMAMAIQISPRSARRWWRSGLRLLACGMVAMWLVSTVLVWMILAPTFLVALLIGAIVTPTDPIVASSIVSGPEARHAIPKRLRGLLSIESGANDGLAYAFVLLPLMVGTAGESGAWREWIWRVVGWEVVGGGLIGLGIGVAAGAVLHGAIGRGWAGRPSMLTAASAVGLFTVGVARVAQSDAVFAVFLAGLGFRHMISERLRAQQEDVQEGLSTLATLPVFLLVGLVLPWQQWWAIGWPGAVIALAVLLFRRLPAIYLGRALVPALRGRADGLLVGWFGPIGVSSLFYASLAVRHGAPMVVWDISTLVMAVSVLVHGLTAAPFGRLYRRHTAADPARRAAA